MSAIWGCIDFSGNPLEEGLCAAMQRPAQAYKIDRFEGVTRKNALMGCGIQYIYGNSQNEPLPIWDESRGLLFTADCVLDNRSQLVAELAPETPHMPDGELLYQAYLRWGNACHHHVLGSYAFAVYDYGQNLLTLAVDFRASRCVYWCRQGTRIYFGTLLHSVVDVLQPRPQVDLDWVADYLTLPFILVGVEPCATPFCGVQRMYPGAYLACTAQGEQRVMHWQPEKLPKLQLENDDAYRAHFLALMDEVAEDYAARDAQVGVYLSGGMDSSAVAAAEAIALERHKKELNTYTSVPIAAYEARRNRRVAEDESEEVRQLCAMYPNMRPHFCALEELDALSIFPHILDAHEVPLKTPANMTWMYAMADAAHKDGCRVMLNGQLGNSTISSGDKYVELYQLVAGGHWIKGLKLVNTIGKRHNTSRKAILKMLLTEFDYSLPPKWQPAARQDILENAAVNEAFADQHGSIERLAVSEPLLEKKVLSRQYSRLNALGNPYAAALVGESFTKLGLACGVAVRDFSADRRIVSFCYTAPDTCFSLNGVDRRLMRDYMAPLLPAAITQNVQQIGLQSADWVARLKRRWPYVQETLENAFDALDPTDFINTPKLRGDLALFPDHYAYKEDLQKLVPIFGVYALEYFLHQNDQSDISAP